MEKKGIVDLKEAIVAIMDNVVLDIKKIVAEIKDLDASEGVELGMLVLSYVPKLMDSLRK